MRTRCSRYQIKKRHLQKAAYSTWTWPRLNAPAADMQISRVVSAFHGLLTRGSGLEATGGDWTTYARGGGQGWSGRAAVTLHVRSC